MTSAQPARNKTTNFCFVMPFHISENRGGGAEVQAWLLARELAARGYQVAYIAQSVQEKVGAVESIDGVTVHWVRPVNRLPWTNSRQYFRAMNATDAEVVVQRMTNFHTGTIAFWCHRHDRRFIWMCTDDTACAKWHAVRRFRDAIQQVRRPIIKRLSLLAIALITDIWRNWGMRHVSVAFTQNDVQSKRVASDFSLNSKRIFSGHVPPDKQNDPLKRLRRPIVLWVANLGPRKQPERFFEMARAAGESDFRFVMIGSHGDPTYLSQLFNDKPANLEWLGKLPFEKTLEWFDLAAFFVNTSTWEGFPNTFVQAWLRGVPVFSLNVDPDQVVTQNALGQVDPEPVQLLKSIRALASDPERYEALSLRVQDYANRHHSIEQMADFFLRDIKQS